MPSYTVSKNGYQSATGSFTWADSNITVTLEENKPERLYAWTDDTVPSTIYYAWKTENDSYLYYTLSETPVEYDTLYDYRNGVMVDVTQTELLELREYDDSTIPARIRIRHEGGGGSFYATRDVNNDKVIYNGIHTLYTASATITTGMALYDNTGTNTGKTIGTINQDGSFDIVASLKSYSVTYNESEYTVTADDKCGALITSTTKSIVNLANDFTVIEI